MLTRFSPYNVFMFPINLLGFMLRFFFQSFRICHLIHGNAIFLSSVSIQAHAKVWHTYDTQWRSKQKGSQWNYSEKHIYVHYDTKLTFRYHCLIGQLNCFHVFFQASLGSHWLLIGESQWTSPTKEISRRQRDTSSFTWAGLLHLSITETTPKWWKTT